MSYLINGVLNHTINVFRTQSYRLLQKSPLAQVCRDIFASRSIAIQSAKVLRRHYCNSNIAYDVNTAVTKDVVLFKYENPKFFHTVNLFAFCQFVFWNYLSHFAFTTLRDAPVEQSTDTELKWYRRLNLGDNKYRNGITAMCFFIGYGVLVAAWMFTLRSVRFLILRKGGREVSFVTYGPFNKNRIMTVPLKHVSAQESRQAARVQLPLKVKNRTLFYILDMRGEFRNPKLFDYTAGMKRRLESA